MTIDACCRPGSSTSKCLRCYYIGLMDALYPICPDCLFIGEGTGATGLAANWGETTLQATLLSDTCRLSWQVLVKLKEGC